MHILWFIIIGLVAGWLAGKLIKGKGFGVIGDIIVGVIGALIGGYLIRLLGISTDGDRRQFHRHLCDELDDGALLPGCRGSASGRRCLCGSRAAVRPGSPRPCGHGHLLVDPVPDVPPEDFPAHLTS